MKALFLRDVYGDDATLSKIFVDGAPYGFGLEDERREPKIPGETAIAAGLYDVRMKTWGGFHDRYLARFGADFHKGMLWLQNVPNFKDVLVHIGNTEKDTAGCLLVGLGRDIHSMTVSRSTEAYTKLYRMVIDAAERDDLTIEFKDGDRKEAA